MLNFARSAPEHEEADPSLPVHRGLAIAAGLLCPFSVLLLVSWHLSPLSGCFESLCRHLLTLHAAVQVPGLTEKWLKSSSTGLDIAADSVPNNPTRKLGLEICLVAKADPDPCGVQSL